MVRAVLINAYATHRDPPALTFPHELRGRRDRDDPQLGPHLNGLMGFVMARGERPMTAMRYGVLRHIDRVRHHLSFDVADDQIAAVEGWARDANAILFLPDGTVRAPDGKILVDPASGDPEPDAMLPYPADAVARKARTDKLLAERGLAVPAHLPPCVSEVEVSLREPREVAARMLALFVCAVRAEGLAHNDPISAELLEQRMPVGFAALSPNERAFVTAKSPAQQDVVDHMWRYEAIFPLAWALGVVESLPFPSQICDVPALAKTLFVFDEAAARLRPVGEILDALDLTFRLDWVVTDARIKQASVPGLEAGAVAERHCALNWLTRFADADWDDVQTPT
jgi:hypothetical protein